MLFPPLGEVGILQINGHSANSNRTSYKELFVGIEICFKQVDFTWVVNWPVKFGFRACNVSGNLKEFQGKVQTDWGSFKNNQTPYSKTRLFSYHHLGKDSCHHSGRPSSPSTKSGGVKLCQGGRLSLTLLVTLPHFRQKPCWAEVSPGYAHSLKTLGRCHEGHRQTSRYLQAPRWDPQLSVNNLCHILYMWACPSIHQIAEPNCPNKRKWW